MLLLLSILFAIGSYIFLLRSWVEEAEEIDE